MLSFQLPGYAAGQRLRLHRPAVISDVVQLPHRLRQQGLWGMEPDMFIADLASLDLVVVNVALPTMQKTSVSAHRTCSGS